MRTLWFPMVQAVSNGDEKPEDALKAFTEKANKTIKKNTISVPNKWLLFNAHAKWSLERSFSF